jgi:RNA recognition motif-containing protein
MKVYLGNLSKEMNDAELGEIVQPFGKPSSAEIAKDRENGSSKGFGFVVFETATEGQAAIDGLNGKEVSGRTLKVMEARPRKGTPTVEAQ